MAQDSSPAQGQGRNAAQPTSGTRSRPYVVVTGAVAAGASTLSQTLIDQLGWVGHLEGAVQSDNAFFIDAYEDFTRWGFHSQVHFLLASVRRHQLLAGMLADSGPPIVEDRTPFEHTGVYLTSYEKLGRIPARESALLRDLTSAVEREYLVPDLLVYRELTNEQLLIRVAGRGRPGEDAADFELLETIRTTFDEFVASWDLSPKIIVPAGLNVLSRTMSEPLLQSVRDVFSSPNNGDG